MQFFQILNWLLCRVLLLTSQLDKNHISCIEEGAFRALRSLEVLWVSWWVQMKSRSSYISCWDDFDLGFSVSSTLNNNNISSIPVSSFNHMPKLRTLWVSAHRTTLPRMQDCSHGKQERDVKNSRQILTNYFSPFSFFLSMFLNVFFLCCSFFVLLAFFLTPSFAIPSFLYPSLSPPIFPYLPFPVLYFIPRPSFPLTFLHSHLCSYPPQCINSFLPFLFLLSCPLSLPWSSSSHLLCPSLRLPPPSRLHSNSLRCDCHLAWLSPWLRQRAALGLYTQCSSPPSLRGLNLAELRKSDFACSGTAAQWHDTLRSTCGWWSWYLNPFPSILFHLFLSRPQRQCLCSAVQPGVRLLPSHVFLQQQHRGLSREGPHCHPRPPARGHDWDVSIIWKFLFQLRQKQSKWRIYCIILESTITATLYLLSVIFNNSPEYSRSQYCNLLTLYLSEGKGVFLLFKARIRRWRLLNDYLSLVDLTWLICIQVRWY